MIHDGKSQSTQIHTVYPEYKTNHNIYPKENMKNPFIPQLTTVASRTTRKFQEL